MKNDDKGFTLIELVVVMIIIGILVLLATPRFIRYIKLAKYTNIINDIRVVETVSLPEMVRSNEFPLGTSELPADNLQEEVKNRNAYLKDGIILKNSKDKYLPEIGDISKTRGDELDDFYKLSREKFIKPETRSRLTGNFYINREGRVIYIDDLNLNHNDNESTGPEEPGEPEEEKEELSTNHDMFTYRKKTNGKLIITGADTSHTGWKDKFQVDSTAGKEKYKFPEIPKYMKTDKNEYIKIVEIANEAFAKFIFVGDFKADYIEKIGKNAFDWAMFDGKLELPRVEEIGIQAFHRSKFSGNFDLPKVVKIEQEAFFNSEFNGYFKANNLTDIGHSAFKESEFVGSFTAENLKEIKSSAFTNSKFKGDLKLPKIEKILENVFIKSEFGPEFYIGEGDQLRYIAKNAFTDDYNKTNKFEVVNPNPEGKYNMTLKEAINNGRIWDAKE